MHPQNALVINLEILPSLRAKIKRWKKIKKSLDGFYLATSPKTLLIKDEVFIAIRDTFSLYVTNFHDPLALYRQLKRNGYELDIPVERDTCWKAS